MKNEFRYKLAKVICRYIPPIISQRIRHYIYPRAMARMSPIQFKTKSVTGSYLESDTAEYHGYSFGVHGYYEWRLLAIALLCRKMKGAIIEIGANIGTETIGFKDIMKEIGPVYAFEPLQTHYHSLKRLFSKGKCSHITIYPYALGAKKCSLKFVVPEDKYTSGTGHILGVESQPKNTIDVKCETLDNMYDGFKNVSIIFMDAEGSELNIINGGLNLIRNDSPILVLEASNKLLGRYNHSIDDLINKIEFLKYSPYKISRFGLKEYKSSDKFKKANLVCIPNGRSHLVKNINLNIKCIGLFPMVSGINPLKQ